MKKYILNIIIPAVIIILCCLLLIILFYNPKEKQTIKLEKVLINNRDYKENKIYIKIDMKEFVDDSFKENNKYENIEASLYIYEDLNYKYIEVIPILNYINAYYIAYDKVNDIGIFSNYNNPKQEDIVRYYLYNKVVEKIYNVSAKKTITEKTDDIIKNYKIKEVENCFNYYLNYKVN